MSIFFLLFQDGSSGFNILAFLPFILIFGIFYFLVIMPQKKQQAEIKTMITELKAGDEVVTNGGVIGKIKEVRDTSFIIQSAEKSFLEIAKTAVVGRKSPDEK
ncbi:MAG TPA: preprotein translocase subunit YajC [Pyrinomonadaceae bacterium]|nr:preprotein translocase subunit YajC [Pyrinomonadaceae bacterium]